MQNISVRVPWHDNGWNGSICKKPSFNNSCLKIKNIFDNKIDQKENDLCLTCVNNCYDDIEYCIKEGGCFMYDNQISTKEIHPYKVMGQKAYQHFKETELIYKPYSLPAKPFYWMMVDRVDKKKPNNKELFDYYGIDYRSNLEDEVCGEIDNFKPMWIQCASNHQNIFEGFYNQIQINKSLVLIYAKQVPFCDDNKRILIGIGKVKNIVKAIPHETDESKEYEYVQSMLWTTQIEHSIREDFSEGFLIPYEEMLSISEKDDSFNFNDIVVKVSDESREEFSYAAELVSYDSTIKILDDCRKAFDLINSKTNNKYSAVSKWIRNEIKNQWNYRGIFPGLGPMLYASGFEKNASAAAEYIMSFEGDTIEQKIDKAYSKGTDLKMKRLLEEYSSTWSYIKASSGKMDLFETLSRISLSLFQASAIWNQESRGASFDKISDDDIVKNPYLLYEKTRLELRNNKESHYISIDKIDYAFVKNDYCTSDSLVYYSTNDKRRLRAHIIDILERNNEEGNTIVPYFMVLDELNSNMYVRDKEITLQNLEINESFIVDNDDIMIETMKDNNLNYFSNKYYKLMRINQFDIEIENTVTGRLCKTDKIIKKNWRELVDNVLPKIEIDDTEEEARKEKAQALSILANNKISVLTGGAGTGKTTILKALCEIEEIYNDNILLLAPTGKATIKLKDSINIDNLVAYNVAQFCYRNNAYDAKTHLFNLEGTKAHYGTVIVDESSMLTTEMLGSLMHMINSANRIILVGDRNQLPPIGSGKPFVDIICYLIDKENKNSKYVCELSKNRRQLGEREDVNFAKIFTKNNDEYISQFSNSDLIKNTNNLEIIKYSNVSEFEGILLNVIKNVCGMKDIDDIAGFNSYFGIEYKNDKFSFSKNYSVKEYIDNMQILSPVKNDLIGIRNINRLIHTKYRFIGQNNRYGDESIVVGDKVINVVNKSMCKHDVEKNTDDKGYVANGELGVIKNFTKSYFNTMFSSQEGFTYGFQNGGEESNNNLELAYALTVHKSQGSDFGTTILVINEPSRMLSRELLYTALTRQREKVYLITNVDIPQLLTYADDDHSDICKRLTDLLCNGDKKYDVDTKPLVRKIVSNNKISYYDDKLIYATEKNFLVRSKSELFISDKLIQNGIDFNYEEPLKLNGYTINPDFTIYAKDSSIIYWEHCGMMSNVKYAYNWKWKEQLYKDNGISVEKGNLIVTKESSEDHFKPEEVRAIIDKIKNK